MGLSIPQYFNEYTVVKGYGPVHTEARWVHNFSVLYLAWYNFYRLSRPIKRIFFLGCVGINQMSLLFLQFNDMINVPFSSEAFVAGLLAFFLDITLHRKDNQTRKDRGMHWWDRFRSFKTDTRSEEFYSLPFNLNKFFPSVWSLGHVVLTCNQIMLLQYHFVGITLRNIDRIFLFYLKLFNYINQLSSTNEYLLFTASLE